jgi:putative ABC transport system permease protein
MMWRDLLAISSGNLWRMKLRTFLTTSGVVIAIAAFVSMLSFGAGNQRLVTDQFTELGLFTTMQVYARDSSGVKDTLPHPPLDAVALDTLATIPGVNFVLPYEPFTVWVTWGDSTLKSKAQALSTAATQMKLFSRLQCGSLFESDSSDHIVITDDFARSLRKDSLETLLGDTVIVAVKVSTLDSGFAHVLEENGVRVMDRLKQISFDSLRVPTYRQRVFNREGNAALQRFINGYLNARNPVADTFVISGVLQAGNHRRLPLESIVIPAARARLFTQAGFSGELTDLAGLLSGKGLLPTSDAGNSQSYSQVTLNLDPTASHTAVRKHVERLGYRAFSYAEQFAQIQRFFLYFDLALGLVGLIALTTASLGIINIMVMSILERKREIGVLKSLGADERDIRALFLVESSVIGALGAGVGLLLGWGITQAASVIARYFMRKEGVPEVDLFALPWWLILTALALGIGVSLLAGLYPAARAARVDPVAALRNE